MSISNIFLKSLSYISEHRNRIIAAALGGLTVVVLVCMVGWFFSVNSVVTLRLASGSSVGTYHAFASALAQVVNAHSERIRIKVVSSNGASDNAELVSGGFADLGIVQSDTDLNKNVKIAAKLFPEIFHLIVREDSDIRNVRDLKGRVVALPGKTSGSSAVFNRLLNHYEFSSEDITLQHGSLNEGVSKLKKGVAQALFVVIAHGNKEIKDLVKEADVRLIPIDQAEAITQVQPSFRSSQIPVGAYSGGKPIPSSPIKVIAVDSLLAVNDGIRDKYIKELTGLMIEKRRQITNLIPQGVHIDKPVETQNLHNGARQYFNRDEPPFIVEYAEPMAFAMSVFLLIISGVWQARSWLSNRRKNRADHYNQDIVKIIARINQATDTGELDVLRDELFKIFSTVLGDLDNDRIEEKSLQSFSFAWEVASSTLNQRQIMLTDSQKSVAA